MATGKEAARAIDSVLTGKDRFAALLGAFEVPQVVPVEPEGGARNASPELALNRRRCSHEEVMLGLTPERAVSECHRCLRCDVKV